MLIIRLFRDHFDSKCFKIKICLFLDSEFSLNLEFIFCQVSARDLFKKFSEIIKIFNLLLSVNLFSIT